MQGDEDSSLASPSPVRALSAPAPCITFGLFLKSWCGERGYRFQVQPQVSPIYKEPPVLKTSPLRAQETEYGVGQVSPCVCLWPGLQELSFPTWGVVITPPYPTKAGALCGQRLHTSGDTPTAPSAPRRCFGRSMPQ